MNLSTGRAHSVLPVFYGQKYSIFIDIDIMKGFTL